MAVPYEKICAEDLRIGHDADTVQVTMPAGGTATGTPINHATFADPTGVAFATLPAASAAKDKVYTINNSATKTAGATVTGGGAYFIRAWSNGTNWICVTPY